MVAVVITIFVLAILASAFTWPLQQQGDAWPAHLTDNGQTAAATIVDLIPLLLWILLAVGIILAIVSVFLGKSAGGL